jgi:hypothetical protein
MPLSRRQQPKYARVLSMITIEQVHTPNGGSRMRAATHTLSSGPGAGRLTGLGWPGGAVTVTRLSGGAGGDDVGGVGRVMPWPVRGEEYRSLAPLPDGTRSQAGAGPARRPWGQAAVPARNPAKASRSAVLNTAVAGTRTADGTW